MRWKILATSLLTLLLVYCRPGPSTVTVTAGDFVVSLQVSTYCARRGEAMTAHATLTNRSAKTQIVESNDQPVFDLLYGDDKGEHRWSNNKLQIPDLLRIELSPSQSKSIDVQWIATYPAYVTARFVNPQDAHGPFEPSVFVYVDNCPGALP